MLKRSMLIAALCSSTLFAAPDGDPADAINFNRDIRPILSNNCFRCHGPDAETRESGLRLDRPESATSELDSGDTAIVPGDIEASQLVARLRTDDEDLRMPPIELGPGLKDDQIALLERWIASGANYEQHWSLQPIRRPEIPNVHDGEPSRFRTSATPRFTFDAGTSTCGRSTLTPLRIRVNISAIGSVIMVVVPPTSSPCGHRESNPGQPTSENRCDKYRTCDTPHEVARTCHIDAQASMRILAHAWPLLFLIYLPRLIT